MTLLGKLEFSVRRDLVIRAPRELVFTYFTDAERWARWWGKGSTIEGRVGGALAIVYPDGSRASGQVLELDAPARVVFSYGYEGEGKPIAPGASRVTVTLTEDPLGTRLDFLHEVADAATRDLHVQGWRYHLAVFATVVGQDLHGDGSGPIERWFTAWNEADEETRARTLEGLVTADVTFQDAHSCTRGRDDLAAHVAGARRHMAGLTFELAGPPRQCQGTAVADWIARKPDGSPLAKGTNVFELTCEGRIARVVGLWG
jgi:uncharacterized protein YndB with AHSA1/START domain